MKKKNLLVICAASGLCLVFMLILIGSMSIYAEKSGTTKQELEVEESKKSDTMMGMLTEDDGKSDVEENVAVEDGAGVVKTEDGAEDAAKTGRMSEEELKDIWEKMYREYEENAKDGERPQEPADDVKISVSEAGLIWLKEIHRLYPDDALEDLSIDFMEPELGINIVYWTGRLENGYGVSEEGYRSYTCQIDPVSGKIVSFGKFQPYQKEKDYSAISWTDEEIKARAKELIDRYDLSLGEELEWDSVEVYNGKEEVDSLKEEFAERPDLSKSVCNTLFFKKDGLAVYDFCMDWASGEISNYLWVERDLP